LSLVLSHKSDTISLGWPEPPRWPWQGTYQALLKRVEEPGVSGPRRLWERSWCGGGELGPLGGPSSLLGAAREPMRSRYA